MPNDDLILNADSSNATAAIKKLIDQNAAMIRSMEQTSKTAEKGSAIAVKAFERQTAAMKLQEKEIKNLQDKLDELNNNTEELGSISTAVWTQVGNMIYGHVKSGVQLAIGELNKYVDELDAILVKQDKIGRKAMIQTKLGEKEYQEVLRTQLAPVTMETGASLDTVQDVFRELVSEGMSREEALNGGVLAIMRGAAATGEENPTDYAVGVMGMLKAYGDDLSGKNIERYNVQASALFDPTNLKSSDMQVLARGAGVYKTAGVDQATALAAFALLKNEVVPDRNPQMAQTNLEGILKNLASFSGNREKTLRVNQLAEQSGIEDLGEMINLQGESLPEALRTLNTALSGFDNVSKMTFATELIGKDFAPAFLSMVENFEKIQQYEQLQKNTVPYEQGYSIAREGIEAATNRAEAQRLIALQEEQAVKTKNEQTLKVYDAVEKEAGFSTTYRSFNRWWRGNEMYLNPTQDMTENRSREGTSSAAFIGAGGGAVPQGMAGSGEYSNPIDAEVIRRMKEITDPNSAKAIKFELPEIITTAPVAPPVLRPAELKRFDFGKELSNPEDLAEDQLKLERDQQQAKVQEARVAAEKDSSEGGLKITKGEQRLIDIEERMLRVLELQLDHFTGQKKEKELRAKSPNSQGGDR